MPSLQKSELWRGVKEDIEANFEHLKISKPLVLVFIPSCLGVYPDRLPGVCPQGQMDAVAAGGVPARSGTGTCRPPVSRMEACVSWCTPGCEAWRIPQPNMMLTSWYRLGKPPGLVIPGGLRRSLNKVTTKAEVRTSEEPGKADTQWGEKEKDP